MWRSGRYPGEGPLAIGSREKVVAKVDPRAAWIGQKWKAAKEGGGVGIVAYRILTMAIVYVG